MHKVSLQLYLLYGRYMDPYVSHKIKYVKCNLHENDI